jgi:hypothetical protein
MNPFLFLPSYQARTLVASTASVLLLLLAGPAAQAQAPTWQTAVATSQAIGSTSTVMATATDAAGNVYVAGAFTGTATFGGTTLISAGNYDLFVAKWNTGTSSFTWAQQAGGAGADRATAIAVSGTSVYVAGQFLSATASFGSTNLINADITTNTNDAFVAKLTDSGTSSSFTWAQRAGGSSQEYANALAVNGTNVYIAGSFMSSTAVFGSTSLNRGTSTDAFVAKLTDAGSTGSFMWAQRAGSSTSGNTNNCYARSLAVNGANVYITGDFYSTANFGNISLANTDNTNATNDAFVAKLTDAGNTSSYTWAQRAGGSSYDYATGIAVNGTSLYIAGGFQSATANFGTTTLSNDLSAISGVNDVFVAKLTDAGSTSSFTWAQRAGGPSDDRAQALAVRGASIYVAGSFESSTANFGSNSLVRANNSPFSSDVFIARLTDAGSTSSFGWAQSAGGTGSNEAKALAVSGNTVYVGGLASPPASFSNQVIAGPASSMIGFLASLNDTTPLATKSTTLSNSIGLYPNPAHVIATVQLPTVPGETQAVLTLTNAVGQVVRTHTATLPAAGLQYPLDLVSLPPGVYALQVQAGATRAVRQLVIN